MEGPVILDRYCCGPGLLGGAVFFPAALDTVGLASTDSPHFLFAGAGVPGS